MAFNVFNMKNLPIIISFEQGTSGRFLQSVINYLITGRAMPPVSDTGAAHDQSEGEQNVEFILLWNDGFCNKYVTSFPRSIDETISLINMQHWNTDRDKFKYYLIEDINRVGFDSTRASMIAEYMNSNPSAPVIRTHIVGVPLLREIKNLVHKPITLIFVSLETPIDKACSEVFSAVKNYSHLYPDPYGENVFALYEKSMNVSKSRSDEENRFITRIHKEQKNEFFFSYSSIVNKDVTYILNFIQTIAHHCEIDITKQQKDEIYNYIIKYLNKQPDMSFHLTRYQSNLTNL